MSSTDNNGLNAASNDADQSMSPAPACSPVQPCGSASPPRDPISAEKKHWVQIEMVNTEGKPVKGENYKINLADGTVVEGSLDEFGRAKIEGIDPGSCTVTFPDLDKDCWDHK